MLSPQAALRPQETGNWRETTRSDRMRNCISTLIFGSFRWLIIRLVEPCQGGGRGFESRRPLQRQSLLLPLRHQAAVSAYASDRDGDLPPCVSGFKISHSVGNLREWVGSVDGRGDLSGFDEL